MELFGEYDATSPESIENYSQKMIGKTFSEICEQDEMTQAGIVRETSEYAVNHENRKRKGGLGELIEERFFHYKCNNDSRPDFYEAGVELKVTPYKINKNGSYSAKERLVITMIDYFQVVKETFENSHLWNKAAIILLVYYLYEANKERLDYRIDYAKLFTPPEDDLKIIRHDFEVIVKKIKAGKAHELSGSDTLYLEAATKAAKSSDRREQPYNSEMAKPRAFAFKNSYMTYVLNNYIIPGKQTYESVLKNEQVDSFEDYVVSKINTNAGKTVQDLCIEYNIETSKKPKSLEALLAYRMLGIKGNKAEEFVKANVVVKTIRIGANDKIKENMSFPTFKFKELIKEEWEDSTFGNYLRETRFMFVVYKYDSNNNLRLRGCQFWNIPYEDLEIQVRSVWEKTKQVLKEGLKVDIRNGKHMSNLPKASDNPVSHVRPHGQNASDTYELPDGRYFPKQCFWLNNSYIYSQIKSDLK